MADPTNQSARQQPKTMSSRLQGMKFMQRASSLSTLKSKSTASPSSTTYPSPKTQDQEPHPAKRVKTSHSANYSPATPSTAVTPLSATNFAVRTVGSQADNESADAALTPQGAEEGETKWFFSFRAEDDANIAGNLKVEMIGVRPLVEDESDTEEIETPLWTEDQGVGRRVFGVDTDRWTRNRARPNGRFQSSSSYARPDPNDLDGDPDSDTSDNDSEEDEEEYDPEQTMKKPDYSADAETMIKAQRKTQRRADRKAAAAEVLAQVEQPPRRVVELSKLSSISGTAGPGVRKATDIVCHLCKEKGHMKKDCPQQGLRY